MSDAQDKCSKCGRSPVMVMTLQANDGKPSDPICLKCLKELNKDLKQKAKTHRPPN